MNASALIEKLQSYVEENGDLPVIMCGFDLEPSQISCVSIKGQDEKWINILNR